MDAELELHDKVCRTATARGAEGTAWLAHLPQLVAALERAWRIEAGRIFPNATEAYVCEAVTADNEQVVLKIPIAGLESAVRELRTLQAANGRGYVRLLRHDAASGAMLLEMLGPQLAQMNMPIDTMIEIICATLQGAWMPLPAGLRLMTGSEKAEGMAAYIERVWPKLGEPCSERARVVALRFAKARRDAFDPATAVLGHGDAHCWNTLADPETGKFKFVDPDGLFIERAHDLSISMREWSSELLAGDPVALGRRRCERLAQLAGVDLEPIWQWGFIERLVNGLLYLEQGPAENAAQFLDVVEAWAQTESV